MFIVNSYEGPDKGNEMELLPWAQNFGSSLISAYSISRFSPHTKARHQWFMNEDVS